MNLLFALLLAAPVKVAFVTQPGQTGTGVCSPKVTVELEDASGAPAAAAAPVQLSLSGPAAFFSTPDCTGNAIDPTLGFVIPAGATAASFYFLHPKPGALTLSVGSSLYPQVSQSWTVVAAPGFASGLGLMTSGPTTLDLGACSQMIQYVFHDFGGALVSTQRALSVLYQPPEFIEFYADASCKTRVLSADLPAGSPGGQVYLRGAIAGTFIVTATSAGLDQGSLQISISGGSHGCASADAGWAALGILPLLRRRRSR